MTYLYSATYHLTIRCFTSLNFCNHMYLIYKSNYQHYSTLFHLKTKNPVNLLTGFFVCDITYDFTIELTFFVLR